DLRDTRQLGSAGRRRPNWSGPGCTAATVHLRQSEQHYRYAECRTEISLRELVVLRARHLEGHAAFDADLRAAVRNRSSSSQPDRKTVLLADELRPDPMHHHAAIRARHDDLQCGDRAAGDSSVLYPVAESRPSRRGRLSDFEEPELGDGAAGRLRRFL